MDWRSEAVAKEPETEQWFAMIPCEPFAPLIFILRKGPGQINWQLCCYVGGYQPMDTGIRDLKLAQEKAHDIVKDHLLHENARWRAAFGPQTGCEMIADERIKQVARKGYTAPHDDSHVNLELADAAVCFLENATHPLHPAGSPDQIWPFAPESWRPDVVPGIKPVDRQAGYVKDLAKAGALIAAEIDRVLRMVPPEPPTGTDPEPPPNPATTQAGVVERRAA